MSYGVPGTFEGVTIPGAHEGGVTIDLRRTTARAEGSVAVRQRARSAPGGDGELHPLRADRIEPGGFVGTRFGQLTGGQPPRPPRAPERRAADRGAAGAWAMGRDFSVSGGATGSHPAQQVALRRLPLRGVRLAKRRLRGGRALRLDQHRPGAPGRRRSAGRAHAGILRLLRLGGRNLRGAAPGPARGERLPAPSAPPPSRSSSPTARTSPTTPSTSATPIWARSTGSAPTCSYASRAAAALRRDSSSATRSATTSTTHRRVSSTRASTASRSTARRRTTRC
jgi:hypothetical protein